MTRVQQTLDGEVTHEPRDRPDTWNWCHECEDWILRSNWLQHKDHSEEAAPDDDGSGGGGDGGGEEEPERVGSVYDITIDYNVTYRFRVAAYTKHQAEDRAKDLRLDASPVDSYHLHTDRREVKEIMSDDPDLPDDWDPYGDERLWEVWD